MMIVDDARVFTRKIVKQTGEFKTSTQKRIKRYLDRLPPNARELIVSSFVAGSLTTLAFGRFHARYWKRFPTSAEVPEAYIKQKKWLKGYVTRCV